VTVAGRVRGVPGFGMPTASKLKRPSPYAVCAVVVGVGSFGSMSWNWFLDLASTLARPSAGHELSSSFYLAWALVVTGCGTLALRAAGPVGLPRPALTWCLGLPQISALLHRRSLRSRVVAAAVAGGLAGFAAMIVLWPVRGWLAWLPPTVGPLMGAALVSVTAAEQAEAPDEGHSARLATTRALGLVAVLTGLLTWYLASYDVITVGAGMALGLVGAPALVILAGGLGRWPAVREAIAAGGIPLGELYRAGEVVDRVSASVAMLTTGLLEPEPRRRHPIRCTATARVTRGWAGWLALLDTRRVLARWPELVVAACLAPLVGSVTRVAGRDWGCVVLTVLAYALASRLARWFFAWNASPSLKFLVPFSNSSTTVTLLAAPVLGVLIFSTAAVALAGLSPWWIASSLVCALVGIQRRVVEASKDAQELALLISTPFGPVPYNQVLRLTSGWDAAVLGGMLSFVLPDATALPTVMIAGLFYVGWAKASTVWAHRHRAPRLEVKPAQERAEQLQI
jgi:hypothetical protein